MNINNQFITRIENLIKSVWQPYAAAGDRTLLICYSPWKQFHSEFWFIPL